MTTRVCCDPLCTHRLRSRSIKLKEQSEDGPLLSRPKPMPTVGRVTRGRQQFMASVTPTLTVPQDRPERAVKKQLKRLHYNFQLKSIDRTTAEVLLDLIRVDALGIRAKLLSMRPKRAGGAWRCAACAQVCVMA